MSLHTELPRQNSCKLGRRPKRRFGYFPRGARAVALSRNTFIHHLFPGLLQRHNIIDEPITGPLDPQTPKNWHKALKFRDRQLIVNELTYLFPHIDNEETRIDHATNLEGFMCEAANSMQEYEMLLTLFQKANGKDHERSSVFSFLSNCSSESDNSDDSRDGSAVFGFLSELDELDEENSFSSDHDSSHYGGSESDY